MVDIEDISFSLCQSDTEAEQRQSSDQMGHTRASVLSQQPDVRHTIRCFKHCTRFVFCFELPEYCPICKQDILRIEMNIPPFVSPSPFICDSWTRTRVFIRPSKGKSFLRDYQNGDDLHCGISDDKGNLYDFDEIGVHVGLTWINCIQIPYDATGIQTQQFLQNISQKWKSLGPFHPTERNCFSFVLAALHGMGLYTEIDKTEFIDKYILPQSKKAAQYISLYRKMVQGGGQFIKDSTTGDGFN